MSYNDVRETCSQCQLPKWTVGVYKEMTDVCIDCYRTRLLQQGFGSTAVEILTNSRTTLPTFPIPQKTPPSSGAGLQASPHGLHTNHQANPRIHRPGNTPLVGRPSRAPKEHCKNWCDLCTFFGTQCAKHRPLPKNTPLGVRRHARHTRQILSYDGAFIFLALLTVAGLTVIALLLAGVIH